MAKELGDLIVRLSLDSSRFENSLDKFEAQMTKVQASCMSAATGLTSFKKVTEKLKGSSDTLTERMRGMLLRLTPIMSARPSGRRCRPRLSRAGLWTSPPRKYATR